MAKSSANSAQKVTFGKRKKGVTKKARNKHDRKERNYRGQGRA